MSAVARWGGTRHAARDPVARSSRAGARAEAAIDGLDRCLISGAGEPLPHGQELFSRTDNAPDGASDQLRLSADQDAARRQGKIQALADRALVLPFRQPDDEHSHLS